MPVSGFSRVNGQSIRKQFEPDQRASEEKKRHDDSLS
jgi:hypothetical protein